MKIVIANFKMNLLYDDILEYIKYLKKYYPKKYDLILAPSSIYLDMFKEFKTCAQNSYYLDKGAYTGELSPKQLSSINVKYSLVGHSERREHFNEDNALLAKKINSLIDNNITPILCIGETWIQKKIDRADDALKLMLKESLSEVEKKDQVIIAYEPVWAIGTGNTPTEDEIIHTVNAIRDYMRITFDVKPKVLYGGSIDQNNFKKIINIKELDGVLIGTFSTYFEKFINILNED